MKQKGRIEGTIFQKESDPVRGCPKATFSQKRERKTNGSDYIKVCMGLGGISAGGQEVLQAFAEQFSRKGLTGKIGRRCRSQKVGCMGFCARDVLVDVMIKDQKTTYQFVKPDMVERIVNQHILGGVPVVEWLAGPEYEQFHQKQEKIVLNQCGRIDPEDIEAYLAVGGYQGAEKALGSMTPDEGYPGDQDLRITGSRRGGFPYRH